VNFWLFLIVILDFDVDLSRDVTEDQLSPASRDSGLAMGGSYRYSNEELATSGTTSSDYEADMMLSLVNGDNVAPSDGQQSMRLPDILEGQPINRLDSGYPNSSSSSVTAVVSRKTGTVRERIHTTRIMKTSSDDSAVCRSSTGDERSSVFDEEFDVEVGHANTNQKTNDQISSRFQEPLADSRVHWRKSSDISRSLDSQEQVSTPSKFEDNGRNSPSGIDTLFNNLNSIHIQKYGSVNKLLVIEDSRSTNSGSDKPIVGAPVTEDLVSQKTLLKRAESFSVIDQQRLDEKKVVPAGKKLQLMAMHSMKDRNVQPALATPEIWPTSSRYPSLSRQNSLEDAEPMKIKKDETRNASSLTVKSKVDESEPRTQAHTVAPVTCSHSSVVISLQPGRDLIHQVNQLQVNRQEQDSANNGDRRQTVKKLQDNILVHNLKPMAPYSHDECSNDSSVNSSSLSFEQNKSLSMAISTKQNGVPGSKRTTFVVGNRDESFNSQGETVDKLRDAGGRAQQPRHRPTPTQSTVVTVTDQCAIIERRQNTSKSAANTRQQQQHLQQTRPDWANATQNEPHHINSTSVNAAVRQQQQQQHQRPVVATSVVHSGRPVTVSAQLIRPHGGGIRQQNEGLPPRNVDDHRVTSAGHGEEFTTANVAKLRSIYVVGER